ncbi:hypothetical protein ACFQ1E_05595 [Sphingomonas canadensis]|uniref:Uncharacterized protein n=1 Tax=Sphingomonas canadensis TaxID=1219257 RepID=A0ABW3H563_9SPHN|nr:hypothetical protein [Sphingomonas canadensis]MCW3835738.1 hypothetical protein [Sphingomonas canadensis]
MDAPPNDSPSHSLAGRIAAAARAMLAHGEAAPPPGRRDWIVAGALAALIAAGPLVTIAGAKLMAGAARADARRMTEAAAPRIAARDAAARDRRVLAALVRRAGAGATLEALAKALPPEARVQFIARGADGRIEADVAAPDPDALRAAIRAEPLLAGLRDAGQRQADTMMIVSLKELAQ